jgi:hypothetical protein
VYLKILGVVLMAFIMLGGAQTEPDESIRWGVDPWYLGDVITEVPKEMELFREDTTVSMTVAGTEVKCNIDKMYRVFLPFKMDSSTLATTAYLGCLDDEIILIQLVFDDNFPQTYEAIQERLEKLYGQVDGAEVIFDGVETSADGTIQQMWKLCQPNELYSVDVAYLVMPSEPPMLVVEFTGGVLTEIINEVLGTGHSQPK